MQPCSTVNTAGEESTEKRLPRDGDWLGRGAGGDTRDACRASKRFEKPQTALQTAFCYTHNLQYTIIASNLAGITAHARLLLVLASDSLVNRFLPACAALVVSLRSDV